MVVYNGTFRGIVIDTYDPAGMNRVRVQVPQVLGSRTSGWAYPAWSIHDMSIWPEDRFPKAGEGVWIRFESPDRMNWIGTFGLTEPALPDPVNAYEAKIHMEGFPWLPKDTPTEVKGWVRSPSGTPNPDPVVVLFQNNTVADAQGEYVWTQVATGPVKIDLSQPNDIYDPKNPDGDGSFNMLFTRTIDPLASNPNLKYKIRFLETGPFGQVDSEIMYTVQPSKSLTLYWTAGDPVWATAKTISGTVAPGAAGLPVPCKVELQVRKQGTTPWSAAGNSDVLPNNTWAISHTRNNPDAIEYQAIFVGHSGWGTAYTPVPPKKYATVTASPALTWDLPGKTMLIGIPVTVSGTLNSAYGVPVPSTVNFQTYVGSTWVTKASPAANSLGNWTMSYTPDANSTQYRMQYPGSGIWLPIVTPTVTRTTVYQTTTTVSTFPATMSYQTAFTVSGSITETVGGKPVTQGTNAIELWYRLTNGPTTTWTKAGLAAPATPSSSGTFTLSHPGLGEVGTIELKVKYLGDGGSFAASESQVYSRLVGLGGVTALTKGTAASTTGSISWSAVNGATSYLLYKNDVYLTSTTALSYTYTGLAANTTYAFEVVSQRLDPGGVAVKGSTSPSVSMNTGKAAVTTSGSFSNKAVASKDSDSHRPDTGWGYLGVDVAQGYWSNSDSRYCGVISYDTATFKSWVISTYGQSVWDNFNVTSGKITMKRHSSGGDNAANKIYWYHCNVTPGSSTTIDLYNVEETAGAAWGDTVTCTLPNSWIETLLRGSASGTITSVKALAIYKNASGAAYQQYKGYTTSGACDMSVSASWSFTSAAAVAPKWY